MSSFLPQSLKCHYFFRKWFKSYWTLFWHSLWRASIFFVLETMIYKLMNSLLRQSLKSFFLNADNDIKVSEELLFLIFWDNDIKVIKFSFATVSEEHSFLFYLNNMKDAASGWVQAQVLVPKVEPIESLEEDFFIRARSTQVMPHSKGVCHEIFDHYFSIIRTHLGPWWTGKNHL